MKKSFLYFMLVMLVFVSCAKERPYLAGHIRRAWDAVMVSCDPYNKGDLHTCAVISSAIKQTLYVYNATVGEMVLSPVVYFPLKIAVGPATDELIAVSSKDKKFPFLFALDRGTQSLYTVRLFPSADKKELSFVSPDKQLLSKAPEHAAAFEAANKVLVILSYPKEGTVELITVKKDTGEIDASVKTVVIKVGGEPSSVVIDDEQTKAVITDRSGNNLHVIELANIEKVLAEKEAPTIKTINIHAKGDTVHLSRRDIGDGKKLYALVLPIGKQEVRVVDIDSENLLAVKTLSEFPTAAYFPDAGSQLCCDGKKHWFSVATIQGKLIYITMQMTDQKLALKDETPIDLTSENNLELSTIKVKKIIGGTVHPNIGGKRSNLCDSNRQVLYFAAYGTSRPANKYVEAVEVESHAYHCEGENTVSRFGFKNR